MQSVEISAFVDAGKIDFVKYSDGLVPAVIQDYTTNKVLMLGFMNKEALLKTIEIKQVTFFSRSKKRFWTKGEESGNFLELKEIKLDCDNDSLLIKVKPLGAVCHTGAGTCWGEENVNDDFLKTLESTIASRKNNPSERSYTSSLFGKGISKIAQKVGEEAVETVIEALTPPAGAGSELFKNEAADLLFHYLVLLQAKELTLKDIEEVLKKRHQPN